MILSQHNVQKYPTKGHEQVLHCLKTTFISGIAHYAKMFISVVQTDLPYCTIARVIEQCCFNSTPDLFNSQTANFTLKPPIIQNNN